MAEYISTVIKFYDINFSVGIIKWFRVMHATATAATTLAQVADVAFQTLHIYYFYRMLGALLRDDKSFTYFLFAFVIIKQR